MKIPKILKRLSCKHQNLKCVTNYYGDMINEVSTCKKIYRSAWVCTDCSKSIFSEYLEPSCNVVNYMPRA